MKRIFLTSTGRTATRAIASAFAKTGLYTTHEFITIASEIIYKLRRSDWSSSDVCVALKKHFATVTADCWVSCGAEASYLMEFIDTVFSGDCGYVYLHRDRHETIESLFWTHPLVKHELEWKHHPNYFRVLRRSAILYKTRRRIAEEFLYSIDDSRKLIVPFDTLQEDGFEHIKNFVGNYLDVNVNAAELQHDYHTTFQNMEAVVTSELELMVPPIRLNRKSIWDETTLKFVNTIMDHDDPSYDFRLAAS